MPRPSPQGEVPPETWTGSGGRLGLLPVLYRAQTFQFQFDALFVVVLDVFHQPSLQTLDAVKAVQIEELRLQRSEKALHCRIVQTVATPGHALLQRVQIGRASCRERV